MNPFDVMLAPNKEIEEETDLPQETPNFLVSREGVYFHNRNMIGHYVVPIKPPYPSTLPSMGGYRGGVFFWTAPKIPSHTISTAIAFFRQVFDSIQAEAELLFLLNADAPENQQYKLLIPHQYVSGGSVKSLYNADTIPDGYQIIGSIHSHCNMGAFHSNTDTGDASSFPGVHLTVGKISSKEPEIAAMVSIGSDILNYSKASSVADVDDLDLEKKVSPTWLHYVRHNRDVWAKDLATDDIWDELKKKMPPQGNQQGNFTGHPGDWRNGWNNGSYHSQPNNTNQQQGKGKKGKENKSWKTGYRYSTVFGVYLPTDWYENSGNYAIKPEYMKAAFEMAFAEFVDLGDDMGFKVTFDIVDVLNNTVETPSTVAELITEEGIANLIDDVVGVPLDAVGSAWTSTTLADGEPPLLPAGME